MFLPWSQETVLKNQAELNTLFTLSFLPGTPETALNCPILINTYKSLTHFSKCKVCQLLYSLIQPKSTPVAFFEDYATLCFYCSQAPRCSISTLMAAADFLELLNIYFPEYVVSHTVYSPENLLAVDIQLHFFILRCFRPVHPEQIISISNLNFLKIEFLLGRLVGHVSTTFCFKTVWQQPYAHVTNERCCSLVKPQNSAASFPNDVPPEISGTFFAAQLGIKPHLLKLALNMWAKAELLSVPNSQLAQNQPDLGFKFPKDGDAAQGPCLLTPSLCLKFKGTTTSVCFLCECLAAHPESHAAFKLLKNDILLSIDNNVQLVDRISFILGSADSLMYIADPLLKALIKGCSAQEIHKHLFCDPQCLLNEMITNENVLFKVPELEPYKKLKAALAAGNYLGNSCSLFCDYLETLITIFKSIQVCKVGKTTFLEIVRELDSLLKKHNISAIHPYQTAQTYT